MQPIHSNWTDDEGNHDGGQSVGIGFTIAWQRGALNEDGRNGAFLIEVMEACLNQIKYFQYGKKFRCDENDVAIAHMEKAIAALESRRNRREEAGTLGTTIEELL